LREPDRLRHTLESLERRVVEVQASERDGVVAALLEWWKNADGVDPLVHAKMFAILSNCRVCERADHGMLTALFEKLPELLNQSPDLGRGVLLFLKAGFEERKNDKDYGLLDAYVFNAEAMKFEEIVLPSMESRLDQLKKEHPRYEEMIDEIIDLAGGNYEM
jgi:hypothetical protein